MRDQTNYNNAVVGISIDGTIYTLDYTFKHDDSLKGAVGSLFVPVCAAYCRERSTIRAVREWWESGTGETLTFAQAREMRDQELNYNCKDFPFQDDSYAYDYDKIKKEAGVKVKTLECVGGGRCFTRDIQWAKIVNPALLDIINKAEEK